MFTSVDKFLVAFLVPLIVYGLGWAGVDVTPDWQAGLVVVLSPAVVWLWPNK